MFSRPLLPYLTGVINYSVAFSSFPDEIKLAKVMSGFKKDDPLYKKKKNYHPIRLFLISQKHLKNYFSTNSIAT